MLPRVFRTTLALAALTTCFGIAASGSASAATPTLQAGRANLEESLLGARYRSFRGTRGGEVYLGVPDLRNPARRSERDLSWVSGSNEIAFTFDPEADLLTTSVINSAGESSLAFPELSEALARLSSGRFGTDDLNALTIRIVVGDAGTRVVLEDVEIDGIPLGDAAGGDEGDDTWTLAGHDFGAGFTLRAKLVLDGRFSGRPERSRVEVAVGVADDPFCVDDDAVAETRALLDAESPYRLKAIVGTPVDLGLAPIRWNFLADDALYLDGQINRAYALCSMADGVMMTIPFADGAEEDLAHFLLEVTSYGFAMHGREQVVVDGFPTYTDAGREYRFRRSR